MTTTYTLRKTYWGAKGYSLVNKIIRELGFPYEFDARGNGAIITAKTTDWDKVEKTLRCWLSGTETGREKAFLNDCLDRVAIGTTSYHLKEQKEEDERKARRDAQIAAKNAADEKRTRECHCPETDMDGTSFDGTCSICEKWERDEDAAHEPVEDAAHEPVDVRQVKCPECGHVQFANLNKWYVCENHKNHLMVQMEADEKAEMEADEKHMLDGIAKDIANIEKEASDVAKAKMRIAGLAALIAAGDFNSDDARCLAHYASYLEGSLKNIECWADAIDDHLGAWSTVNYRELRWDRTLNMLVSGVESAVLEVMRG